MAERVLHGHLGTRVTIDVCDGCQAFWFDGHESLRLSPGSTLELFATIGDAGATPRQALADTSRCPRCGDPLKLVNDLQRNTRFQYRACPARHGRLISFFNFLREKNFIQPLSQAQIEELRTHVRAVNCSNCGAVVDLADAMSCEHCGSPLSMVDMNQAKKLVAELQQAAHPDTRSVDPALPLRLERARRETESTFASFERDEAWYQNASSIGLVGAGLGAISRWLKGR